MASSWKNLLASAKSLSVCLRVWQGPCLLLPDSPCDQEAASCPDIFQDRHCRRFRGKSRQGRSRRQDRRRRKQCATSELSAGCRLYSQWRRKAAKGYEELQKAIFGVRVVKCFNTAYAQHMAEGWVAGRQLSVFATGDDEAARKTVPELVRADSSPLENVRYLESLA